MSTVFIDFDGCIVHHDDNYFITHDANKLEWKGVFTSNLINSTRNKILEWYVDGHIIIITTGRPEIQRQMVTEFLAKAGIYCHQLVMGCGAGVRHLINDIDPDNAKVNKAVAHNVTRNSDEISRIKIT